MKKRRTAYTFFYQIPPYRIMIKSVHKGYGKADAVDIFQRSTPVFLLYKVECRKRTVWGNAQVKK